MGYYKRLLIEEMEREWDDAQDLSQEDLMLQVEEQLQAPDPVLLCLTGKELSQYWLEIKR